MLNSSVSYYQSIIEKKIHENISRLSGPLPLQEACAYALTNGGKRIRPLLTLMVSRGIENSGDFFEKILEGALATEFFHTASLIADDLPCMDNDKWRRGKLCLHKAYNESIALLTTYALISAGYAKIAASAPSSEAMGLVIQTAAYCTGVEGATGGQYLDLFPPPATTTVLKDIIYKKTAALFELSFVMGWIWGGGALTFLSQIRQLAAHFGNAFQIKDDIDDVEEDRKQRRINAVIILGEKECRTWFENEVDNFYTTLDKLPLDGKELRELVEYLITR